MNIQEHKDFYCGISISIERREEFHYIETVANDCIRDDLYLY